MNSCSYINIFLRTAPPKKVVKNLELVKNVEAVLYSSCQGKFDLYE